MKRIAGFATVLVVMMVLGPCRPSLAGAPHQVAGFKLGGDIKDYEGRVKADSAMPIRHMETLSEVEVKPLSGFRIGYLVYGACAEPGKIIRIRLKYEQEDKAFFEELLAQYEKKFGKPQEYKGDVFRAFLSWKWSFTDEAGQRISLILQRSSEDDEDEFSPGITVKLTSTSAMEKEQACCEKKVGRPGDKTNSQGTPGKRMDFEDLIPQ